MYKTFSDIRPVNLREMTVGAFTVDRERVIKKKKEVYVGSSEGVRCA